MQSFRVHAVPVLFCFCKVDPVREMAMIEALITSQQFLQGGNIGSGNGGLHSTGFQFAWRFERFWVLCGTHNALLLTFSGKVQVYCGSLRMFE